LPIATWIGNPTTMRNGNGDNMKARSIDQIVVMNHQRIRSVAATQTQ